MHIQIKKQGPLINGLSFAFFRVHSLIPIPLITLGQSEELGRQELNKEKKVSTAKEKGLRFVTFPSLFYRQKLERLLQDISLR